MGFLSNILGGRQQNRLLDNDVVIITKEPLSDNQKLAIVGAVYTGIEEGFTDKAIIRKIRQDAGIYATINLDWKEKEIIVTIS